MPNPQIHDSMLRNYLNDEANMLTICNALCNTDCRNPTEIVFTTSDGTFFSNLKNDLACLFLNHFLILAEYQTTINENMPLRMLMYLVEQIKQYLTDKRRLIYRNPILHLPRVHCVVLYSGKAKEKDYRIMRLSDAFCGYEFAPELLVEVYNINYGSRNKLIDNSLPLQHYARFIHRIRNNQANGMSQDNAIREAAQYCKTNGIMAEYLTAKEKEVFDMLGFEWNEDEAHAAYFEDGMQQGMQQGRIATWVNAIRNLSAKQGITSVTAMDILDIPATDRPAIIAAL